MRKTEKLFRRLLLDYRGKLVKMPYNKQRSRIVDAITFLIEEDFNEQRKSS